MNVCGDLKPKVVAGGDMTGLICVKTCGDVWRVSGGLSGRCAVECMAMVEGSGELWRWVVLVVGVGRRPILNGLFGADECVL